MAGFWKKFTSGLDFWDKEENQRQRNDFSRQKQEEEEEKARRRVEQRQAARNRPQPGQVFSPETSPILDTPLKRPAIVGSQSQFNIEDMLRPQKVSNPILAMAKEQTPQQKVEALRKKAVRDEIEDLTELNLPKALAEGKQQSSWFDRQVMNRDWDKEARTKAKERATMQYQEKYGYNKDPDVFAIRKEAATEREGQAGKGTSKIIAPVLSVGRVGTGIVEGGAGLYDMVANRTLNVPEDKQNRVTKASVKKAKEIDKLAEDLDMKGLYQGLNVPLEIATYFTPGLVTKLGKAPVVASKLGKLGKFVKPITTAATKVDDLFKGAPKLQKFIREGASEFVDPKNIEKELELTGRYMGQDSARGEEINKGDVAENAAQAFGGAFLPAILRRGLNKFRGGKTAADVGATTGGTATSQIIDTATRSSEASKIPGTLPSVPSAEITPPKVSVADGVKTTPNIETLRAQANDLDTPAFQRTAVKEELAAAEEAATNAEIDRMGVGEAPMDKPSFQHKQDIKSVIDDGQAQLDEFMNANQGASRLEIENAQASINQQVMDAIERLQNARYGDTPVNIPAADNTMALGKADSTVGAVDENTPIADFSRSVQAPLSKAPAVSPAMVQNPSVASVDANGNPVMTTDAQVARDMAADGMAPTPGASPVAATEDELLREAERAANAQVTSSPASPRERANFASTENDPALAQEILDNIPGKQRFNTEEMLSIARNNARAQTPEMLVAKWSDEVEINQNNAQAWINALEERKMLNAMINNGVPGAREARLNLADAMSKFQSKSGQNLNVLKVAYDEMPGDMKAELLIKKIDRERRKAGLDALPDRETEELLNRVVAADEASQVVKQIETDMADFNRAITQGSATPEARVQLEDLTKKREDALVDLYERNAVVTDYFSQVSPDAAFGQKLANWNRVSMLSSLTGRVFDMISTTGTNILDTANRSMSAIAGKVLNKVGVGDGGAKSTLPQLMPSPSDLMKAAGTTIDSARGKNQVRDVMAEISGMGTGRSELQNQSRGRFRNLVKAATEAPTEVTKYIEADEIYRTGRQRANELGLKGDDAELYADSYGSVATSAEKYGAQQEHLRANMLHNNAVSSKIDQASNVLLNSSSQTGKTVGAILKSVVAPFTRFIGGMTHRTFTDMNVVHNVWQMRKALKNGDTQMLADNLAKFTTNTTVAFATATVLAETGMLTTQDANGDSYGGLYLHFGDRYIPVAVLGLASVPMIVGYGMNQAAKAESPADAFTAATTDTFSRVLASTGTAGFFGADNALQTAISGASSAINPSESGANEKDMADVLGSMFRQSIPAGFNDINAVLNQIPGFNPTGEAAETKVLNEDGTQNPLATQGAKTQNTIPGLSQMLDRREGTPARDLLDRSLKGNRETGEMSNERITKENLSDTKKALEKEGVPVTAEKIKDLAKTGDWDKALLGAEYRLRELEADEKATENSKKEARYEIEDYNFGKKYGYMATTEEAVQARAEDGNYDAAIAGWQVRKDRDEKEGNTPKSKLESQGRKIKRYEVFRDNEVTPGMATAYEKTDSDDGGVGVTAWREMMESGDPEQVAYAERLATIDDAMRDSGATKELKYYWGKNGKGSGRSGRGSPGGGKEPRFITDIATQSFNEGGIFKPMKAQAATFGEQQSAIPTVEGVPSYSRQLKKISVSRGSR